MLSDSPQPVLALRTVAALDVAAASGIAWRGDRLYVVADDELSLGVYTFDGARTDSIALAPGTLSDDPVTRKATKPDYEALFALSSVDMLVLGSGSTGQRERGAWLRFGVAGVTVESIELGELYQTLRTELPELNIEGGAILGDAIYLCSRGDGARRDNALIRLDRARALTRMRLDHSLPADAIQEVVPVALPELDATPLSLTDLAVVDETLLFSAAAEATTNTYDDGECKGSVIGTLTGEGRVQRLRLCTPRLKLEGVCAQPADGGVKLWLVSDADDRAARAPLMQIDWRR